MLMMIIIIIIITVRSSFIAGALTAATIAIVFVACKQQLVLLLLILSFLLLLFGCYCCSCGLDYGCWNQSGLFRCRPCKGKLPCGSIFIHSCLCNRRCNVRGHYHRRFSTITMAIMLVIIIVVVQRIE